MFFTMGNLEKGRIQTNKYLLYVLVSEVVPITSNILTVFSLPLPRSFSILVNSVMSLLDTGTQCYFSGK